MNLELEKQLKMTYENQCTYLQRKYGLPKRDYFATEGCHSKSKNISRTSEGLFIHHNYENIGGNLGEPHMARMYPFEYQKKENLCYCTYLEHLILHLKINVLSKSTIEWPHQIKRFFNSMGFDWICQEINELYRNGGSDQKWRNDCYLVIKDNFRDYIEILRGTICFVDTNYANEKQIAIAEGTQLLFEYIVPTESLESIKRGQIKYAQYFGTVIKVDNSENGKTVLKYDDGREEEYETIKLKRRFDYYYNLIPHIRAMCYLYDGTVWDKMYTEFKFSVPFSDKEKEIAKWLKEGIR